MNILNKLTIKHLMMNKKRTIMSIVGILLSTALMVGVGLLSSVFREYAIKEIEDQNGRYNSKIENVETSKLSIIKGNDNIEAYFYNYVKEIAKPNKVTDYKPYFYINAVNKEYLNEIKLIEGKLPKESNEIVISDSILYEGGYDYKIGDSIILDIGKRYLSSEELTTDYIYDKEETFTKTGSKTYKITGVVNSPYEDYESAGFGIYTLDSNKENHLVNLYMVFNDPAKTIELSQNIYKNLGKKLIEGSYVIDYNTSLLSMYGASNYNNVKDFITNFLGIFLSIVSVACIIVIYNSFAISVMERKKQFGLFSSIGATKSQIRKTVFFEALIVGIVGITLGILCAYIGIGLLILILNSLLHDVMPLGLELVTYPLFIIIPIIFIVVVILISAFLPARSASKISPIEVIRQNDDIKIKRKKLRTPKILSRLFGVEGDIALKNMKRNKKKYRITIISLFISIVTFIAFSSYLHYGTSTAESYMGNIDFNINLSYNDKLSDEYKTIVTNIVNSEQIDKKLEFTRAFTMIKPIDKKLYTDSYLDYIKSNDMATSPDSSNYMDGLSIFVLNKEDYSKYKEKLNLKEDRPIIVNTINYLDYSNASRKVHTTKVFNKNASIEYNACSYNELYNNEKYKDESGNIKLSDKDLQTYYKDKCYYTFKNIYLTNTTPDLGEDLVSDRSIIISEDMFEDYKKAYEENSKTTYNSDDWHEVIISASKYDKIDKIAEGIKINNNIYYYNYSKEKESQDNLLLAIKILLYGFITLVTLIGITSVFNTINTSINLRKREFSVLRSIGLTPSGFNKMIWYESILFGLKALLYGIPVGIGLTYLIYKAMTELVDNPFVVPIEPIIICIIGVFAIILLTMWYSTAKIKKENILEAIRDENI